jgi:D-lactate dehydrogenase (cytochrome)
VPRRHGDRRRGAGVTRVELLDGWTIAAINEHQGTDLPVGPSLFVEACGSAGPSRPTSSSSRRSRVEGSLDVVAERDPTARSRSGRPGTRPRTPWPRLAGKRHRPTDVCVPLSELAGAVSFARAELDRRGLVAGIVGHAGDGNVHLSLMVDPDDEASSAPPTS